LFRGTFTATSAVTFHPIPKTIAYDPASIASGTSRDVIFLKNSGQPIASTSVAIWLADYSTGTLTIAIASSGVISY
jgi:hypothetical protein